MKRSLLLVLLVGCGAPDPVGGDAAGLPDAADEPVGVEHDAAPEAAALDAGAEDAAKEAAAPDWIGQIEQTCGAGWACWWTTDHGYDTDAGCVACTIHSNASCSPWGKGCETNGTGIGGGIVDAGPPITMEYCPDRTTCEPF
ncbi:MAG TPA: hypothetical protein VMI75_15615 [Polyangiaceae bacterium]|nr:hypothetical protein [Polyangiaceae bacterium]